MARKNKQSQLQTVRIKERFEVKQGPNYWHIIDNYTHKRFGKHNKYQSARIRCNDLNDSWFDQVKWALIETNAIMQVESTF